MQVLQRLGRSEETVDEMYEANARSFNKQVAAATKLEEGIKGFDRAIRGS